MRLYEKGLIYRGPRLINWSPGSARPPSPTWKWNTRESRASCISSSIRWQTVGEFIPVATTRPETILGDTAVAVHPDDERYRQYDRQDRRSCRCSDARSR